MMEGGGGVFAISAQYLYTFASNEFVQVPTLKVHKIEIFLASILKLYCFFVSYVKILRFYKKIF
jgi:hypothetical protein